MDGGLTKGAVSVGLFFAVFYLAACSQSGLALQFDTAAKLNLNQYQQSLPVLVRVYQLSDDTHFRSGTFSQLWKHDVTFLQKDLICSHELYLNPGSQKKITLKPCKGAKYVGIFALFRRSHNDHWKIIFPIKSHLMYQKFYFRLTDSQIEEVN